MTTNEHRQLERLALASLNEDECPEPERIAAYILGELSGNEQLTVAAHVRRCPLCQHDIAQCRPPEPRKATRVARLLPALLVEGRRSSAAHDQVRQYVVADLAIDLTVAPPVAERWRITGQVLRADEGVPDLSIILRAGRRRYEQTSDDLGFFTFDGVPEGRYTLSVIDKQVQVQIRNLDLRLEET
jgi:anti-sigma factor RsiW